MPFGGLLSAGIGAAGSLFGGLFGGGAAAKAQKEYLDALKQAQGSLQDSENKGLANYQPYLDAGGAATRNLSDLMGTPGSGLLTPWNKTFTAPTAAQAEQTPGYKFQLKAGEDALQNSAAGKGSLLTGRTLADLNNFAQGTASSNYQNVFNNAFTQYQSAYDTFRNNQSDTYSRLMGLSGQGLQAAGGAGSLISGIGGDIASLYGQSGAAKASGTMAQANAYGGILPGIAGAFQNYGLLKNLNGGSGGWSGTTDFNPSIWKGGPSSFPGGGSGMPAPFDPFNLPGGSFANLGSLG